MEIADTVIVGGGAAGLMAAWSAARRGGRVVLLEGGSRIGRKILISGNGRCNLTNRSADAPEHYHSGRPRFVIAALRCLPVARTLDLFGELGIETREEKRGRLFPLSDQAQAVIDVLLDRLALVGVEVVTDAKVCSLARDEVFRLATVSGRRWRAGRVVLASGGVSLPKLGADRSGIDLAVSLGHTCTELWPGLVPLVSADPFVRRMQGVKVWAEVSAPLERGQTAKDTDDLLFTPYGLSGFTVLNLSARLVPLLARGPRPLHIGLFPGRTPEQVSEVLRARWERNPHRSLAVSFSGLLSSKLVVPFLERWGLPAQQRVDRLSRAQRWHLAQALTCWPVEVSGPRSFAHAEVTVGGIRTEEVDPETLESRRVPGLYLAGEMLDVQGDLGGYNFQWAWSSGYLAGQGLGSP
ncbi:MAG: NAD(P)/FAD-dependent oxidoreductase [Candidatus Latescibacterota bacterium]